MDTELKLYKENGDRTNNMEEAAYFIETRVMTIEEFKKVYPLYRT